MREKKKYRNILIDEEDDDDDDVVVADDDDEEDDGSCNSSKSKTDFVPRCCRCYYWYAEYRLRGKPGRSPIRELTGSDVA